VPLSSRVWSKPPSGRAAKTGGQRWVGSQYARSPPTRRENSQTSRPISDRHGRLQHVMSRVHYYLNNRHEVTVDVAAPRVYLPITGSASWPRLICTALCVRDAVHSGKGTCVTYRLSQTRWASFAEVMRDRGSPCARPSACASTEQTF
jgi:hypothetical protein